MNQKSTARLAVFAAFVLILLPARPAPADEATEARFHFERGVELFKQAKVQLALEQFLLSNRLVKNSNAVFNAGKCFELLNKFNEAFALFSEYLLFEELTGEERAEGEKKLEEVRKKVATIKIETTPAGAEIFLDRKDLGSWGTTPRIVAVPPGSHEIIIELKHYHSRKVPVSAVIGEQQDITADLEIKIGKVRFLGTCGEAFVTVDGDDKMKVKVPATYEFPVGDHVFRIEAQGYVPVDMDVTVDPVETTKLDLALAPLPPPTGNLNIVSSPSAALVKIDGKEFGFTPIVKPAHSGKHTISVQQEGRQSWSEKFQLGKDDSLFLNVDLVPEGIPKKHKQGQLAVWGLGGVFGATGIVTGGLALSTKRKYKDDPSMKLHDRGEILNLATDLLFTAAVLAIVSATVWYLITRRAAKMQSKGEFSYKKPEIDYNLNEGNAAKEGAP
jgi:outer membrane receptor for ferrienterochelin and colicins